MARLIGRYLSKGLTREEILPILFDINSRNKPPLGEKEVEVTLDSIIKTHQQSLSERVEYKKEEKGQRINYHLTTLDQVLEYPEPNYLIDPVLIEGTVSVLGAYTGTGKSIAALSIINPFLQAMPFGKNTRLTRPALFCSSTKKHQKGFSGRGLKRWDLFQDFLSICSTSKMSAWTGTIFSLP